MAFLTQPHELTEKKTFKGLICGQPASEKTTLALFQTPSASMLIMVCIAYPLFFDALLCRLETIYNLFQLLKSKKINRSFFSITRSEEKNGEQTINLPIVPAVRAKISSKNPILWLIWK